MRANHTNTKLWPGLLLVSVGLGLTAREFGLLPPQVRVLDFWPLFIVLIGISVLLRASGLVSALLALAFIGTGGVLLAGNLGFLASSTTRLWPVLIVLLGLWALFRGRQTTEPFEPEPEPVLDHDGPAPDDPSSPASAFEPRSSAFANYQSTEQDRLNRQYTCSGTELKIESQAWRGGSVGVTAGGVELDLRQARLAPEGAVLVLRVLMGGVEIRVPDTWQVQLDVVPFFGGADDTTRSTQGASASPRLRIIGNVTLGGVSVSN